MNRRGFLKFMGCVPVVVATAGVAIVASASSRYDEMHEQVAWLEPGPNSFTTELQEMSFYRLREDDLIQISEWKAS